jgi:geranylgeranyl diphosphate synthase, type II
MLDKGAEQQMKDCGKSPQSKASRQPKWKMNIKTYLKEKKELVDSFLESYFDISFVPAVLNSAMGYSLFAGGKRIRPILALASYEACGGIAEEILPYAVALEFVHTYSLIHDDLPAMDNDDLRRGKPTNHKVFGEGIAILAGDALLTEAFYLLSNHTHRTSRIAHRSVLWMIREIAMASGAHGMVGGQAEDILSENKTLDSDSLSFIHAHKTGALITASVRMGGILANAKKKTLHALTQYGENIGLAFQIVDDVLNVQGDSRELGKRTGSDERMKKVTYPGLYGVDLSMKKAEELVNSALDVLRSFSEEAEPLREIASYILRRKN